MRAFTDLCVLTAVYGGPRIRLYNYLRSTYNISIKTLYAVNRRLIPAGLIMREAAPGKQEVYIHNITDAGRVVCDQEMVEVAARVDPLSQLEVPPATGAEPPPSSTRRFTVLSSAEWRVLLAMLQHDGAASASVLGAEAAVDLDMPAQLLTILRAVPPLNVSRAAQRFELTDFGRDRAHAALTMGRQMCADWKGGGQGTMTA